MLRTPQRMDDQQRRADQERFETHRRDVEAQRRANQEGFENIKVQRRADEAQRGADEEQRCIASDERTLAVTHTYHVKLSTPPCTDALKDEEHHREMRRRELLFRTGVFVSVNTLVEPEPVGSDPEESEYEPDE